MKLKACLRLTAAAAVLTFLLGTHLLAYYAGRVEGFSQGQRKRSSGANGLYESMPPLVEVP
jgi:hypothetical protein